MTIEVPCFTIMDGDKIVDTFDGGYDGLFLFIKEKHPDLLGEITGDPNLVFLYGSAPMLYDKKTKELKILRYVQVSHNDAHKEGEDK